MRERLRALAQVGALKALRRAGWGRAGVPGDQAESVAGHSHRAAVLALVVAGELGVDADRLVRLLLVHDLPESDPAVGDITPYDGVAPEEKRRRERAAMERLCAGLPEPSGRELMALWSEYDAGATPEADAAHQIDALEMALQACEYEDRLGLDLAEFRASARAKVRHPALRRWLDALEPAPPGEVTPT